MAKPRYFVGIDLGTTYSTLCYVDEAGHVEAMRLPDGTYTLASAVYFKSPTEIIVGTDALNFSVLEPDKVVREFKRHMGEPNYKCEVDGRSYRPEELSAMVLRRLLDGAREKLGPIEKAVVTVPQVFQEARRRATQDAGTIAGLTSVEIVEEPVAAALAYGNTLLKSGGFFNLGDVFLDERILVYDLGGGTFDATVMLLHAEKEGEFKTLATIGDERLGGKDFDDVLESLLIDRFAQQSGYDPRLPPVNKELLQEFRLKAIEAKISLSELKRITVSITYKDKEYQIPLPIGDFERASLALLTRTEHTLVEMLEKNDLRWGDVDRILLVGGSSRMPMVGKMLQRISGRTLDLSLPPDTAVAKGAALFAASQSLGSKIKVKTVNSHPLGLMANSRQGQAVNSVILPANRPTRTRVEKSFDVTPGMKTILLPIMLGEARDPSMCNLLGRLRVFNLPPNLPPQSKAKVGFLFQENGLLKVDVEIHPGGEQAPIQANFEVVVEGIMGENDVREATQTLRGIEIE